ncbi:MAG TPA: glucose-6-phosphate dehydrogenase assembly protein OpcA [Candidatus Nanopelagicales bacterium]|nr:glucose-6-phosphate dehydrogenase assembly protein OpcA [Candidatus Nanopelagicales bacterium]
MSVRLDDTTAAAVSNAISAERFRQGSSAVGRVLTLVIVADEATQADAMRAAAEAGREHPSRILVAIPRPGRGPARLDAEVSVGGTDGLGEVVELRLRGPLAHHVASVVLPLLVPDAPVVVWWPGAAPEVPSDDPVGRLGQRRITDSAESGRPMKALEANRRGYRAGDTDLAWTRITPWRALIASSLDQPFGAVTGAAVSAQRSSPSALLLAAWLQRNLGVPVLLHTSRGPGITGVTLTTETGDITISRPDGRIARMTRPGFPPREAALHRRTTDGIIAEELRRLDPDEIYGETLEELPHLAGWPSQGNHGHVRRTKGPSHQDGIDVVDGADADADRAARARATTPAARKPASKRAAAARTTATKPAATKKTPTKKATTKKATTKKAPSTRAAKAPARRSTGGRS